MPKLKNTALDDLNVGDTITLFSADPAHRIVTGTYQGLVRFPSRRWYAVIDDGQPEYAGISTADIERIERHLKAVLSTSDADDQAEPPAAASSQRDPSADPDLALSIILFVLGFITGMAFTAVATNL